MPFVMRVAYSKIKDVTTSYSTQPFFASRQTIQSALTDKVSSAITAATNGAVALMNLQLRQIALEDSVSLIENYKIV